MRALALGSALAGCGGGGGSSSMDAAIADDAGSAADAPVAVDARADAVVIYDAAVDRPPPMVVDGPLAPPDLPRSAA